MKPIQHSPLATPAATAGIIEVPATSATDIDWSSAPKLPQPVAQATITPATAPTANPNAILEHLSHWRTVRKLPETQNDLLNIMQRRGLLSVASGYAVVSPKGIEYLVDFGLI